MAESEAMLLMGIAESEGLLNCKPHTMRLHEVNTLWSAMHYQTRYIQMDDGACATVLLKPHRGLSPAYTGFTKAKCRPHTRTHRPARTQAPRSSPGLYTFIAFQPTTTSYSQQICDPTPDSSQLNKHSRHTEIVTSKGTLQ